jgi:hypothetical protein
MMSGVEYLTQSGQQSVDGYPLPVRGVRSGMPDHTPIKNTERRSGNCVIVTVTMPPRYIGYVV